MPKDTKPNPDFKGPRRGSKLAERLNKETILEQMPKICYRNCYDGTTRVGRSDWPGDVFIVMQNREWLAFKAGIDYLSLPQYNWEDDD